MAYIDRLIEEKPGGDENRVTDLFNNDSISDELIVNGINGDWYHFEPKTYDGEYFIKAGNGYDCYQQDHGEKSYSISFCNIHEVAVYYFTNTEYIKISQPITKK